MMAPVSVAKSMRTWGLKRFWQYQSASARTSRPSASVLMTSMVWPDMEVTMSPGRCAVAEGMFSASAMTPTAFTLALRSASAFISPMTTPEPPMSHFICSMPAAGLMEMPPVSKVMPLPIKPRGRLSLALGIPLQRMITSRGGRALPWPTPSSAPMPSWASRFSFRTSTLTPSAVRVLACRARVSG